MLSFAFTVNIDPCHICHHRSHMSQASFPESDFSIRRHAVQQLLRQALDAEPQGVYGLLGGHDNNVETVLPLHGACQKGVIHDVLQSWQSKGVHPLAMYSNEPDTALPTALLPDAISAILPSLPRLIIRSDTKGRIEAMLLTQASNTQTQTCSLEMQEDGGLYPLVDKG
jgi:hypothetical protein